MATVIAHTTYYPSKSLEGLWKSTKNISQDSQPCSNLECPKYEVSMLTTQSQHLVGISHSKQL
jgi:hypothetical protein